MKKNPIIPPAFDHKRLLKKEEADPNLEELVRLARVLGSSDVCLISLKEISVGINVSKLMKVCGWPGDIKTSEAEASGEPLSWVAGLILVG
ncbi:MAG: hypothetical protein HY787_20055 [Deltaproteobacteria bacterium]|nr:hypothetical protein [Deltaproteobacteria bacterium]